MSHSIRIFLACSLTSQLYDHIAELIHLLHADFANEKIKWVTREKLHLTLHFIGETSAEKINQLHNLLIKHLTDIQSFNIQSQALDIFPSSAPRIIALLFNNSIELNTLYTLVEESIVECGLPQEQRVYLPHVTLGRFNKLPNEILINEIINSGNARLNNLNLTDNKQTATVSGIELISSEITSIENMNKTIYKTLEKIKLISPH